MPSWGVRQAGGGGGGSFNGRGPFYDTWWEEFPVNLIQDVGTSVKAGDKITVSVVRSGAKYTVKVTDSTTRVTASPAASAARRRPVRTPQPVDRGGTR